MPFMNQRSKTGRATTLYISTMYCIPLKISKSNTSASVNPKSLVVFGHTSYVIIYTYIYTHIKYYIDMGGLVYNRYGGFLKQGYP